MDISRADALRVFLCDTIVSADPSRDHHSCTVKTKHMAIIILSLHFASIELNPHLSEPDSSNRDGQIGR